MCTTPVAVEVFLPTYSVVLPTPEMNPPSGLSEAWASPPAPMLIGGGFTFVFLSGPDISPRWNDVTGFSCERKFPLGECVGVFPECAQDI